MGLDDVVGEARPGRIDVWVPDGAPLPRALARTTVLGVGAHPDDLELAAWGPASCAGRDGSWFSGIVCTDGAGTPVAGADGRARAATRRVEQRRAATLGAYASVVQLGHASAELVDAVGRAVVVDELVALLDAAAPELVVTHDPLDPHPTHLAVVAAVVEACRRLPAGRRPARLLGVEGWRPLAALAEADLVRLDVTDRGALLRDLVACHRSEVEVVPYDRAAEGRRRANATFADPHRVAGAEQVVLAVDLTAATAPDGPSLAEVAAGFVDRARREALERLERIERPGSTGPVRSSG